MNIKLYNAAYAQLRAKAMEALAMIDILLNDPSSAPENTTAVEEIMRHTLDMVQYEGAMHSLQQYFQPQPVAPPAPAPPPAPTEPPVVVTPEMSPTYKKSLEKQKIKDSAKARSKKKKDE